MSWRSKYKPRIWGSGWWDDEEEYYNERYGTNTAPTDEYGGYTHKPKPVSTGGWYSSWYKPRFNMSVGLEVRVTQLIKTLTGKTLKLAKSDKGWGSNEEVFFYNPADLEDATDDEVLGRILHQLAREIYIDPVILEEQKGKDKPYRHLIDALANNFADYQLQLKYMGCKYYAEELWHARKWTDNPMNKPEQGETFESWIRKHDASNVGIDLESRLASRDLDIPSVEQYALSKGWIPLQSHIDAAEFNFNIDALMNGELEWDFTKPGIEENFIKAIPFIHKFMEAEDDSAPQAEAYKEIKKLYPVPTEQEQKQMDKNASGMGQMGRSEIAREMARVASSSEMRGRELRGDAFRGHQPDWDEDDDDYEVTNEEGEMQKERNMATYKKYMAKNKPIINTLHNLIRSILKDNATKRYSRPYKRGKIDSKRMYKYLATDNLRIFKKPLAISKMDYPMTIVVDLSGSMLSDRKSFYATNGVIVLAETLEMLGLPYEIIGYNANIYNIKQFHEPLRRDLIPNLEYANGDNNEPDVVKVITEHYKKFDPTNRYHKTVFFITDGEAYSPASTKMLVTQLENDYDTRVYAIGIGDGVRESSLKQVYNTVLKVDAVNELPSTLVSLMRSKFRRH